MCVGDDEREYCKSSRVSLDKLSQSHIEATEETGLVERILKLLRIKHIPPIGLSQQYATQECVPTKFIALKEDGTAAFVSSGGDSAPISAGVSQH